MNTNPQTLTTPYQLLGGRDELVHDLVSVFYSHMAATEPELAKTHPLDENGLVSRETQQRFALFLIEWLGGAAHYSQKHGHPRLRMRHAHVPITVSQRDAWLRCMDHAMNECKITGEVRDFLDIRFAEVASFLQNRPNPSP